MIFEQHFNLMFPQYQYLHLMFPQYGFHAVLVGNRRKIVTYIHHKYLKYFVPHGTKNLVSQKWFVLVYFKPTLKNTFRIKILFGRTKKFSNTFLRNEYLDKCSQNAAKWSTRGRLSDILIDRVLPRNVVPFAVATWNISCQPKKLLALRWSQESIPSVLQSRCIG